MIEGDDYFSEEFVMKREPMLYHMYVGRFSDRNGGIKESMARPELSKFIFSRIDKQEYEASLSEAY